MPCRHADMQNFDEWAERHVRFEFCIHEGRYSIKSAKFLNYLITACEGFVISKDGQYSLHYLLVILFTNWGRQHLISRCRVKVNRQIQKAFDFIKRGYTPIYYIKLRIFLLLDIGLDFDDHVCCHIAVAPWNILKMATTCKESDNETELVGKIQKGHYDCCQHSCLKTVNCFGCYVFI